MYVKYRKLTLSSENKVRNEKAWRAIANNTECKPTCCRQKLSARLKLHSGFLRTLSRQANENMEQDDGIDARELQLTSDVSINQRDPEYCI